MMSKLIKCIKLSFSCAISTKLSKEKFDRYSRRIFISLINSEIFKLESPITHSDLFRSFYFKLTVFTWEMFFHLSVTEMSQYENIIKEKTLKNLDNIFTVLDDELLMDFNMTCLHNQRDPDKASFKFFEFDLNIHVLFVKLLASVSFDYQILLDWLISNEITFLRYFVSYLKCLNHELTTSGTINLQKIFNSEENRSNFNNFNRSLGNKSAGSTSVGWFYLSSALKCLTDLDRKIKKVKRSFPYDCEPLIKLLNTFVSLSS
jgi:hypothetical protein